MTLPSDPFARAAAIVAHDGPWGDNAVVPPIVQTSLFTFDSVAAMTETFCGRHVRPVYSRGDNPTVRAFEEKVAALEEAEDALAFGSGMAAISSAVMAFVSPGDVLVSTTHVYPDAFRFFERVLRRFGVAVRYADPSDRAAFAAALEGATVAYLESPNSWMMDAVPLGEVAALAREAGVLTIADNSWATPVFQRPHALGVDLVLHSASKYLSGHSDVVAGVVAGRAAHIGRLRSDVLPYFGGKLSPFEAWLLLRGLRTLPARMAEHQRTALQLAEQLQAHEGVTTVRLPGLDGTLPEGLSGTSALFSIELAAHVDVTAFCDALQIFKLGVSWGGHESLVVPALVAHAQAAEPNPARFFGVPERIVRLHAGLEGADLLWSDLAQALKNATKGSPHETNAHSRGPDGGARRHSLGADA